MKQFKMRFKKDDHVCIISCDGFLPDEVKVVKCTVDSVHNEFGTYHVLREDGRIAHVADRELFATEYEARRCLSINASVISKREEKLAKKLLEAMK